MPKLGHSENVPDVSIEKMVADHNEEPLSEESENERSTPITAPVTEPVPTEPKKKRKLSEKQIDALRRGREKKREQNEAKKKNQATAPAEESSPSQASLPLTEAPSAPSAKKLKTTPKKKTAPLPPPSPSSDESAEDSDPETQIDRYLDQKRIQSKMPPRPPLLQRSVGRMYSNNVTFV